ncbi:MAG: hypothetical protein H6700_10450 [Myxococcales bacterium]|nr:hypothetical protein [Myxococcales bacterium]
MGSTSRFLGAWLVAATAAQLAAGCSSEGTEETPFTVAIVRPAGADVVYVANPTEFAAEVTGVSSSYDPSDHQFLYDWDFGDGGATIGAPATVQYTFAQQGQRFVTVVAREVNDRGETRHEAEARISIAVNPAADLELADAALTLSQAVVRSGDTFRFSGNLLNNAARVPGAFDVGFYIGDPNAIDPAASLTTAELATHVATGAAIQVGATSFDGFDEQPAQAVVDNQALTVPDTADSGEYVVFAYVDPAGAIGELDETNNVAFATRRLTFENSVGEGPDLTVRAVNVRPTLANTLSTVTVTATIANVGTDFSPPFDYAVYLSAGNPALGDDDLEIFRSRIENIPAGRDFTLAEEQILLASPITELGDYFVLVAADVGEEVEETNERNNVIASGRVTVTDIEVPGADIVPTEFSVSPETTFLGGTVQIDLTVANEGTDPVPSQFNCKIYFSSDATLDLTSDPLIQTLLLPPLEVGEVRAETVDAFVPGFIDAGVYTPIAACDPTLLIGESDDSNNVIVADRTLTVAADANVDLVAREFSVNPTTVANDDPVTVSVDVCNDGSNGSTPSVVRVVISPDSIVDATDSVLLESRVPPIDPGACITIRGEVPARCDTFTDEYTVFALVDAANQLSEADEANNTLELGQLFTITGLICACVADRFEPNNAPSTAGFVNPSVGAYEDMTMCSQNVDYYLVPLLRDETVRATIRFESDRGNLDMELFALDLSTVLDRSATDGDIEEVSFIRVPQRGNYLLRVRGREPGDRNVYDLNVEVTSPEAGTDLIVLDATVDDPTPVLGDTVSVCFNLVNLGDTAAGPSVARLYLSEDTAVDPIEDALIGELAVEGFADRVYRCVDVTIPDDSGGGERYIAVVADARDDVPGELSESNNVGFTGELIVDDACFDVLEPNNALTDPRLLDLFGTPPVTFTELRVCSENRDFYEFCVSDGDFLSVTANFDSAFGDVDLKLYNDAGVEVDRSEGIGDSENVGVDYAVGDRCYRVEVYVAGRDREVPYTMSVDTGPAPDSLACSRIEEPNDGFATAAPLRSYLSTCMAVCPDTDEDYFYVQLTPGTRVEFDLTGVDGGAPPAELRMTLWGPARNFLTNTIRADETLAYTVPLTGRHYVRVRSNGDGPRNQPYCLEVRGVTGVDLVPSEFEIESDFAAPGATLRFDFVLANTRELPSTATTYALYLSTDAVLSGDDRLLRVVDIDALDGLDERLEGRRFDVPADLIDGGDYFVILSVDDEDRVDEFNETNNITFVPLMILPRCLPDVAEPNNYPVDAVSYDDVRGEPLTSCGAGDADWYSFVAGRPSTSVSIDFADADGDLDLFVYDAVLGLVGFSDGIGDGESVRALTTVGQTYYVEVRQHTDRTPEYTLTVE